MSFALIFSATVLSFSVYEDTHEFHLTDGAMSESWHVRQPAFFGFTSPRGDADVMDLLKLESNSRGKITANFRLADGLLRGNSRPQRV